MRAISPKKSPGSNRLILRPPRVTLASPSIMMWNVSPGFPSSASVAPSEKLSSSVSAAMWRRCRFARPANSGTSASVSGPPLAMWLPSLPLPGPPGSLAVLSQPAVATISTLVRAS